MVGIVHDVSSGSIVSITQSLQYNTEYCWYVILNDSKVENKSKTWCFKTIKDTIPPRIYNINVWPSSQHINGSVNISCIVEDNVGIKEVWINISYPDGSYLNTTMANYYFNHTYSIIGDYSFFIFAIDANNNTNKSSVYFFQIYNQKPMCNLSANPKEGKAPLVVTFHIDACDIDGYIKEWKLDVNNDGIAEYNGSELPANIQHTYKAGTYIANLTVIDDKGAKCYDTVEIIAKRYYKLVVSINPSDAGFVTPSEENMRKEVL